MPVKGKKMKSSSEIRKKQRKIHRKVLKGKKSATEPALKRRKIDEEITSDDDEDIHDIIAESKAATSVAEDLYEEEEETPQEKKIRLTKQYLEEIKRNKDDNSEMVTDYVAQKLKEDMLEAAGQLRKPIADVVANVDEFYVKHMHCRWHDKSITCVVTSDKYIFTASKNGSIAKWSFQLKEKLIKSNHNSDLPGHKTTILSLAISSDGKFLASGDLEGHINIWNADTLRHLKIFKSHQKAVSGLSFQRGTHTLFSCSHDRLVMIWNIDILALVEHCGGHADSITSLDCHTKESCISSGGSDQTIVINMFQEDKQLMYKSKHSSVDGVKLLNEKTFITFGQEGSICLWITSKKWPMHTVPAAHGREGNGVPHWITAVATLINTDLFASGSTDNLIRLWKVDMSKKKMEVIKTIDVAGIINCLEFTSSGSHLLAAVGQEHKLGRWMKVKVKNTLAIIDLRNNKMEE